MQPEAMYVHVPFCQSICAYCDFTRVGIHPTLVERWLDTLAIELEERVPNHRLKTLYLGGGTPTALSERQLERLLTLLLPYAQDLEEYTVELNPETISDAKIRLFKRYHVNRLSIGLQSKSERLLRLMKRRHTWPEVVRLIDTLRKNGFTNLSLDCMYSLPTQTMEEWQDTLDALIEMNIPHLSLYSLTIEKNSEFGRTHQQPLNEDEEAAMYFEACQRLASAGYEHYEISNFALPNHRSKHNQVYWHYEDFYGIGLGASGKENHVRYDNTVNFERYFQRQWIDETIPLEKADEQFEMLMMNLRLKEGLSLNRFEQAFGCSLKETYPKALEEALRRGWLRVTDDRLCCSENGFPILNTVLTLFLT